MGTEAFAHFCLACLAPARFDGFHFLSTFHFTCSVRRLNEANSPGVGNFSLYVFSVPFIAPAPRAVSCSSAHGL